MNGVVVILWIVHCTPAQCELSETVPEATYGTVNHPIEVPYDLASCNAQASQLATSWMTRNAPGQTLAAYGCMLKHSERNS